MAVFTDGAFGDGGAGGGAPVDAPYLTTTAVSGLSGESNLGALATGVLQIAVSGGTATPSTFAASATRIPFGSSTAGHLTDSADLTSNDATNILTCVGAIRAGITLPSAASFFGEQLASATGAPHQVEIGNTSGDCHLRIGQSATRNMGFLWDHNVTVGNAFAEWNSFGYSNPGKVNFSVFLINPDSGGTAAVGDACHFALGSTTGTKWGTATTQKQAWFDATPVVQQASIADPSGGATIDAEARTAIIALITRLETYGFIATV